MTNLPYLSKARFTDGIHIHMIFMLFGRQIIGLVNHISWSKIFGSKKRKKHFSKSCETFAFKYISLLSFFGTLTNRADPEQTPQNTASDKGRHCLRTYCSIKI